MSFRVALGAVGIAFSCCVFSLGQAAASPAVVPTDRLNEPWWAERHQQVLAEVKAHPDAQLLMIGDSITNNYDKSKLPDENFQPTWQQFYAPRKALNLGFSGDKTENLLWRLDHGEVEGLHPKVAVLLIGTNNTGVGKQTAVQTESGIDAVIADLENKMPGTRILLLGILPSELSSEKSAYDRDINAYLAKCYGESSRVTYLDINSIFYAHGVLDTSTFYDPRLPGHPPALHPDTNGQRRMAEAIEPTLAKLMGDSPRMSLDAMTDVETSVIPVDWLEQDSYDWYARHHAELAAKQQITPQVVMIGDSITHFWDGEPHAVHVNGPTAWESLFEKTPVLNMGFGWDRTQNVLWRLRQGEFDGLHPKWVVVNIGTNNMKGTSHARASTPSEVADGVTAIIDEVHRRSPESRIVLMAIFPRGESPTAEFRAPIAETNRLLAERYKASSLVTWVDIGAQFLNQDGSLPTTIMFDGTHPTDAGYKIWADALKKIGVEQ